MALTQKEVKEEIALAEKMIKDTAEERNEVLEKIKKQTDGSNKINLLSDENLMTDVDEYNGLLTTIQYYTGHLNALNWVLNKMKAKK